MDIILQEKAKLKVVLTEVVSGNGCGWSGRAGQWGSGLAGSGSSGVRDWRLPWDILPQALARRCLKLPLSRAFWTRRLPTSCCHKGGAFCAWGRGTLVIHPQGPAVLWQQGQRRMASICSPSATELLPCWIPSLKWGIGMKQGLSDQERLGLNLGSAIHWL